MAADFRGYVSSRKPYATIEMPTRIGIMHFSRINKIERDAFRIRRLIQVTLADETLMDHSATDFQLSESRSNT
jgi:hypothetical protein